MEPDRYDRDPDRQLDLNKSEAHLVAIALDFAANHDEGWAGRSTHEPKLNELSKRARRVWDGEADA